jgi:peptidoglycan hydrolase CwlO-like protein
MTDDLDILKFESQKQISKYNDEIYELNRKLNELGFKNETATDKIQRLEKELMNIDNNTTELNHTFAKDNMEIKDKYSKLD